MTIKEVCSRYNVSADTLRYYEKVGVIPQVHRTPGGIRDYTEEDLGWVEMATCFRSAGMPIDMLTEYVRLFREGDSTMEARCNLLKEAREKIIEERKKYEDALERMNFKIERYEKALITGILDWSQE